MWATECYSQHVYKFTTLWNCLSETCHMSHTLIMSSYSMLMLTFVICLYKHRKSYQCPEICVYKFMGFICSTQYRALMFISLEVFPHEKHSFSAWCDQYLSWQCMCYEKGKLLQDPLSLEAVLSEDSQGMFSVNVGWCIAWYQLEFMLIKL